MLYNQDKPLIIVGDGETAKIAYEYFYCDSPLTPIAFSVEKEYLRRDSLNNLPVVPLEKLEELYPAKDYQCFVAISSSKLNRVRRRIYLELNIMGYELASYVSSRAFVWRNVEIGKNCFIFEDNTLQPFVKIGDNVTLWSGNHIGHNSVIRDHCFLTSHVVVSGFCDIGEGCFLGVNSTIINNIKVAKDCFIGAGALIQKDTEEGSVYQEASTVLSKVTSLRLFKIRD